MMIIKLETANGGMKRVRVISRSLTHRCRNPTCSQSIVSQESSKWLPVSLQETQGWSYHSDCTSRHFAWLCCSIYNSWSFSWNLCLSFLSLGCWLCYTFQRKSGTTLSPFISLGLFFANRVLSIVNFLSANGMTIQYLFTLTANNEENHQNNVFFCPSWNPKSWQSQTFQRNVEHRSFGSLWTPRLKWTLK